MWEQLFLIFLNDFPLKTYFDMVVFKGDILSNKVNIEFIEQILTGVA